MADKLRELFSLDGKVALVTGAARGIGRAIALSLAGAGADVAVSDVDAEGAKAVAAQVSVGGRRSLGLGMDCGEEASVVEGVAAVARELGGLDVLVNNAGIFPPAPIEKMSADLFDRVQRVNLRGAFLCMREAARVMKAGGRGGRIINIASIDGLHPSFVGMGAYGASKAGLIHLTRMGAVELGPAGITVNAICPGGVRTEGVAPAFDAGMEKTLVGRIPLGRVGKPEEVAAMVVALAAPAASYVNGAALVVDGGYLQT